MKHTNLKVLDSVDFCYVGKSMKRANLNVMDSVLTLLFMISKGIIIPFVLYRMVKVDKIK